MRYLYIIALVCFFSSSYAQVTGVQGKRAVIKTDVLNYVIGKGPNIAFEYAFSRKYSVELEYRNRNENFKPYFEVYDGNTSTQDEEKWNVKQNYYTLTLKRYKSTSFNPPKGMFYYLKIGYGKAKIEGIAKLYAYDEIYGDFRTTRRPFVAKNISIIPLELGYGKQWIIKNWISVEVSGGLNLTAMPISDEIETLYPIRATVGPSVYSITGREAYDAQGDIISDMAIGISLNVKLGFLLPM